MTDRTRWKDVAGVSALGIILVGGLLGILLGGRAYSRRQRNIARAQTLIGELMMAVAQYELDFRRFPPGKGDLSENEDLYGALTSPSWRGRHQFKDSDTGDTDGDGKPELVDPWGAPIRYYAPYSPADGTTTRRFRLVSVGPDGEEGTADEIERP